MIGDAQAGLRNLRGDVAGYLRLLHRLDADHGEAMDKLDSLLAEGRVDEAMRLLHTLKGAAGTLGLTRLQEAARALEEHLRSHPGREGDKETYRLSDGVSAEHIQLREALARIDARSAPERTVDPDLESGVS